MTALGSYKGSVCKKPRPPHDYTKISYVKGWAHDARSWPLSANGLSMLIRLWHVMRREELQARARPQLSGTLHKTGWGTTLACDSTLWCSFIFKLLGSLLVSGDVCSTYGGGVHRQSDYCPGDWHAACAPVIAWIQFSGESHLAWSSAVMTLIPSKSEFFLLMHEISKQSQYFFNFMRSLRGGH